MEDVSVDVFAMDGRHLMHQNLGKLGPGAHAIDLDLRMGNGNLYFTSPYRIGKNRQEGLLR